MTTIQPAAKMREESFRPLEWNLPKTPENPEFDRYHVIDGGKIPDSLDLVGAIGITWDPQVNGNCFHKVVGWYLKYKALRFNGPGTLDPGLIHTCVVTDKLPDKKKIDPRTGEPYTIRGKHIIGHSTWAGIITSAMHLNMTGDEASGQVFWVPRDVKFRKILCEVVDRHSAPRRAVKRNGRTKTRKLAGFAMFDLVRSPFVMRNNTRYAMKRLAMIVTDMARRDRLHDRWGLRSFTCAGFGAIATQGAMILSKFKERDWEKVDKLSRKKFRDYVYQQMKTKGSTLYELVREHAVCKLSGKFILPCVFANGMDQLSQAHEPFLPKHKPLKLVD